MKKRGHSILLLGFFTSLTLVGFVSLIACTSCDEENSKTTACHISCPKAKNGTLNFEQGIEVSFEIKLFNDKTNEEIKLDSDDIDFEIENMLSWMKFDTKTKTISGKIPPKQEDSTIKISLKENKKISADPCELKIKNNELKIDTIINKREVYSYSGCDVSLDDVQLATYSKINNIKIDKVKYKITDKKDFIKGMDFDEEHGKFLGKYDNGGWCALQVNSSYFNEDTKSEITSPSKVITFYVDDELFINNKEPLVFSSKKGSNIDRELKITGNWTYLMYNDVSLKLQNNSKLWPTGIELKKDPNNGWKICGSLAEDVPNGYTVTLAASIENNLTSSQAFSVVFQNEKITIKNPNKKNIYGKVGDKTTTTEALSTLNESQKALTNITYSLDKNSIDRKLAIDSKTGVINWKDVTKGFEDMVIVTAKTQTGNLIATTAMQFEIAEDIVVINDDGKELTYTFAPGSTHALFANEDKLEVSTDNGTIVDDCVFTLTTNEGEKQSIPQWIVIDKNIGKIEIIVPSSAKTISLSLVLTVTSKKYGNLEDSISFTIKIVEK